MEKTNAQLQLENEKLIELCKALLKGADKCSGEPYYIVQPFMGIVIEHREVISDLKLV